MPALKNHPILAYILKQLGLKLLINPWDGLTSFGIKQFGAMLHNTFGFLCAKFPCNFGG
jgi:hypothetical protein